jgi:hypothetical protein
MLTFINGMAEEKQAFQDGRQGVDEVMRGIG